MVMGAQSKDASPSGQKMQNKGVTAEVKSEK